MVCEDCRKRHTICTHRGSADGSSSPGKIPKNGVAVIIPRKSVGGKDSMQAESVQIINNAIRQIRALPAPASTKERGETTALDKELREIAYKATMGALKRKLDEAEKAEEEKKSTLAATKSTKRACLARIKELDKQEARDQTAAVEAEKLIEQLKLRIVQQEGRGDL